MPPGVEPYPGRTKYDRSMAARYSRRSPARNREEGRVLARILEGMPPGCEVIDVPCGAGRVSRLLTDHGHRVTSADLSSDMLCEASSALGKEARLLRADLLRLPFSGGSFDHAFCIRLFHHLPSPATRVAMLRELGRVTRGSVVLTFFHPISTHNFARWLRGKLTGRKSFRFSFTCGTLRLEASMAGLALERAIAVRAYQKDLWFAVLGKAK
jgi:ubiquinone/menaquinone biosynthesis C-methylase UbiE